MHIIFSVFKVKKECLRLNFPRRCFLSSGGIRNCMEDEVKGSPCVNRPLNEKHK